MNNLLERGGPLYLWYSTLGLNPTTLVPVSYFLAAARGQVRFDIMYQKCRF
jgi:hypothetical protein